MEQQEKLFDELLEEDHDKQVQYVSVSFCNDSPDITGLAQEANVVFRRVMEVLDSLRNISIVIKVAIVHGSDALTQGFIHIFGLFVAVCHRERMLLV